MSRNFGAQTTYATRIILNVYDLTENNEIMYPIGLGLYHSGVQVGNYEEYTFASGGGVFSHAPKQANGARFRTSVDMGAFNGTSSELASVVDSLRPLFKGDAYHLLNCNCNSFADALLLKLVGKEIPGYVNRLAFIGSAFSCLLPDSLINDAPVDNGSSSSSGGSSRNSSSSSSSSSQKTSNYTFGTSKGGVKLGGQSSSSSASSSSSSTTSSSSSSSAVGAGADKDTTALLSKEEKREQMRAVHERRAATRT